MGIAESEERGDLTRAYIERLEAALAAATHERDLEQERARLAGDGVAGLERRLEQLRQGLERERVEAERELERRAADAERALAEVERERERELAKVRARLDAREKHLENAQAGIESRDRRLNAANDALEARAKELDGLGEELKARDGELSKAAAALEARRTEVAVARARLELREEELERSRTSAREARRELDVMRERLATRERELDEVRARLEVREGHLRTAQLGVESRDRKLVAAERTLESRDAELASQSADLASRDTELDRLRAAARDRERKLALAEARLAKAQQRVEHFQGSLVELREGRAYRLMRILWRLRRPFRRAPRDAAERDGSEDDSEVSPAPQVVVAAEPPQPAPPELDLAPSSRIDQRRQPGERLRVASILDEMSEACFAPECDLVPLTLERWAEQLDERRPDLLLVESAWNGNGGEWQYRIAQYRREDLAGLPALRALLEGCRERGIPTAFWNKEDPVHFERFSEAAALFDHVFTTDARCGDRYRALPGERTVTSLPFAAQPRIHNPAAAVPVRSSSPCFAGAWYRDRHPDRRRALAALLDAARPHGLVIYDRSFGGEDGAFGFPERFAPHVLGKLPYDRILDVYKTHQVFLNANSVADSPTMCSRRVFELAACDTAILSTPGAALRTLLGDGVVDEAEDEQAAAVALERLLGDEAERRRRTRAARRAVFAEHTYADRLATIAETAGLDASSLRRQPFAVPGEPANGGGASSNGAADRHPWLLALQPGVALSQPAFADLSAAATFADADVIGTHPASNGDAAIEHRHVPQLDPTVLLLRRELVEARGPLSDSPAQIHTQLRQWSDEGVRLYAADADLVTVTRSVA